MQVACLAWSLIAEVGRPRSISLVILSCVRPGGSMFVELMSAVLVVFDDTLSGGCFVRLIFGFVVLCLVFGGEVPLLSLIHI